MPCGGTPGATRRGSGRQTWRQLRLSYGMKDGRVRRCLRRSDRDHILVSSLDFSDLGGSTSSHWRAGAIAWTTSSATHPPQPPQPACELTTTPRRHGLARRCRTRLREEVDDGQGHAGGAEGSMSIFVGSCGRLAQPGLSPRCPRRGWLTAGAASQRGTASSVERSTHEAIGRGRRRGRGLGVLLRAAATVSAGARQAGRRDQCRQREARPRGPFEGVLARAWGGPLINESAALVKEKLALACSLRRGFADEAATSGEVKVEWPR